MVRGGTISPEWALAALSCKGQGQLSQGQQTVALAQQGRLISSRMAPRASCSNTGLKRQHRRQLQQHQGQDSTKATGGTAGHSDQPGSGTHKALGRQ